MGPFSDASCPKVDNPGISKAPKRTQPHLHVTAFMTVAYTTISLCESFEWASL